MTSEGTRIKVLPERLANKIAAGEVIERPASAAKELIENALDAGATVVRVETEIGGRRLIRVTDDGEGMAPDEALLSIERHATSKIANDDDLFAIQTLGFRGEALPSIAAVSRFELLTRAKGYDEGVRVRVEGGTVETVEPAGCAPGTVVTVRNLFYNVPARLKFLRSKATELGHITDTVARIALARPAVHFQLMHDGREVIDTPPSADRSARIADSLGLTVFKQMREVRFEIDEDHVIHGYTSLPALHRSSGSNMYVYVNGRFVRDRIINHAIIEAYRGLLPKGRYPVVVIFIETPPAEVDVNVHPTKAEVRFREGGRIHDAVRNTVLQAFERKSHPDEQPISPTSPGGPVPVDAPRESVRRALERSVEIHDRPQAVPQPSHRRPSLREIDEKVLPPESRERHWPPPGTRSSITPVTEPKYEGYFASLNVLGQLRNTYVVCQGPEGLVLIDQHAAHERTAFERLKRDYEERQIQRQALLFPETLELGLKEAREMNRVLDMMGSLGFEVEPFGRNSYLVRALPAILGGADPKALVLDLLDALADTSSPDTLQDRLDDIFARLSCHAVTRAGKALKVDEMRALLKSLDEADYPLTCPHGRPISVRISYEELEKMFGRR